MDDLKTMSGEELISRFNITARADSRSEILRRLNEYGRLRQIVKDAPHKKECLYSEAYGTPHDVDCWKKEIAP